MYVALGHEKYRHLIQWVIVICLETHLFELAGKILLRKSLCMCSYSSIVSLWSAETIHL